MTFERCCHLNFDEKRKGFGCMKFMQRYRGMNLQCSRFYQLFTSSTSLEKKHTKKTQNPKRDRSNNIGASYPWCIVAILSYFESLFKIK